MILMIDNYDSFTYNIVQYLYELDYEVEIKRNDDITVEEIKTLNPKAIILSPGPCTPNEAGICLQVLEQLATSYPILGVCLGHQAICQAFGGKVIHAKELMHGKTSPVFHNNSGVFTDLPSPFTATRYHSLIAEKSSLPNCLEITSWTEDDTIMGVRHKSLAIEGVQFHPESIATEHGHTMLNNFLQKYR
jgi:anthranilate synthase, component II (EC 4.1.3.27)